MIKYIIGVMILGMVGCGGARVTGQAEDYNGKEVTWMGNEYTVTKAECEMITEGAGNFIFTKIPETNFNKDIELLYCDNSDPTGNCKAQLPSGQMIVRSGVASINNIYYAYYDCAGNNNSADNLWWFVSVNN